MGLNFEQVWAAIIAMSREAEKRQQEADKRRQEMEQAAEKRRQEMEQAAEKRQQEADKRQREMEQAAEKRQQEADKRQKETEKLQRETTLLVRRLSKNVGGVNHTLGRLMEAMYAAQLWDKFGAFGYGFTKGGPNIKFVKDGQVIAEADIFLEDGSYVMAVEVKTDLDNDDVDDHLERLATIRGYMDDHGDKRILLGAVAGGIAPVDVVKYAQKKGLHVVGWSGKLATVLEAPQSFKAREWGISGL
jgi:hypothetical protein